MIKARATLTAAGVAAVALLAAGCGSEAPSEGAIQATGSATVEPITSYMANRYDFDVNVEAIGSNDGFEKFCNGEADINNASISIPGAGDEVDFQKQCADNNVEYIELPIGLDAITIVKHRDNDWATDLSIQQIHDIWSVDSPVTRWSDIDPSWPDEEIALYGRPQGSGTLDVFKQLVLDGDEIREDYQATDDIQELSEWVADDVNALSFMGIGNYLETDEEARDVIDNVRVDGIEPTAEETQSGNYPLARPLFIYVNEESANREDVDEFVTTYLDNAEAVMPRLFFYQLPEDEYGRVKERYAERTTGPDDQWHI
ncbi:substrate-binding domain-containing protein [Corynebacterium timonense]|uniref:Phosphate ABC transporter substrate-binding protein, PhoT family n=1 Tax=Corynebacterium timonense TaxID=441500 RepID=A0A1H1L5B4_9CORY|nr:substrate-binding domain-containing protein [Corynebacterium timonense]SDR69673.1 phosphate ABC transporter substrate-binding protein, PhoT family [Corynebacterium timonense]